MVRNGKKQVLAITWDATGKVETIWIDRNKLHPGRLSSYNGRRRSGKHWFRLVW